ncbi:MAG: CAP domain-containing protein [Bacillota bacterium]
MIPVNGSPFAMIKRFGISYRTAGENIAGNASVSGAHRALMNSPGHRANILSTKYTHIGIGIQQGGDYGMMFTQMFVGR